jgi:hypothetical protein
MLNFSGENLESNNTIPKNHSLWELKPETAQVSKAASGLINKGDLKMISCRFPAHFYPEELYTEEDLEKLDEDELSFIVRHYIKK